MLAHNKKLKKLWDKAPKEVTSWCISFKDGPATEAFKKELLKVLLAKKKK